MKNFILLKKSAANPDKFLLPNLAHRLSMLAHSLPSLAKVECGLKLSLLLHRTNAVQNLGINNNEMTCYKFMNKRN
ncbi:TPA: hypothetical protein I7661_06290 [Vibrio vulnificus]|nr:hypothetical protein [Vibrio vulnificus]